jgi:hypothetical protein
VGGLTVLVRADGPDTAAPVAASQFGAVSQFGASSAVIALPAAGGDRAVAVGGRADGLAEAVTAVVTPLHDLMRQFQECLVVMTRMFTTLQQEQMALARDQLAEFQQAAREFREIRSELAAAPFAETAVDRPPDAAPRPAPAHGPPPPKPLEPKAASELASADEWLRKRLADMERQLGQAGPST